MARPSISVRQVAQELGYRASVRALSLAQGNGTPLRAALVSLDVTPEALGAFFLGPVLAGIMTGAGDEGLEVHHAVLRPDGGNAAAALDRLVAEDRADGLLVLTTRALAPEDVAPLDRAGVLYGLEVRPESRLLAALWGAQILRYPGSPAVRQDALTKGRASAHRLLGDGLPGTGRVSTAIVGFSDWCAPGVLRASVERGVPCRCRSSSR